MSSSFDLFLIYDKGLDELDGQVAQVKTINQFSFSIDLELSSSINNKFVSGLFKKIKQVKRIQFEELELQLSKPRLIISDLSEEKYMEPYLIHVAMHALLLCESEHTCGDYLLAAELLAKRFESDNGLELDRSALRKVGEVLYATRKARFPALCAFLGWQISFTHLYFKM